jgi:ankyrin repeat protein
MCRYLQDIGLDLGLLNDNGHSALHKAAVKGQQSVCTWLLSTGGGGLGAAHMRADGDGNTPAEMARLEGYIELGRWLEAEALRMAKD